MRYNGRMDVAERSRSPLSNAYADGFVPPALVEECANSVTHGLGFALSVVGGIILMQRVFERGTLAVAVACGVYVAALLGVYGASTLSHVFQAPELKCRLRKWDQGLIYLLIVGTYTPLAVAYFGGFGLGLFLLMVWAVAAVGFLSKVVWKHRVGQISTWSYVFLGWAPALAVKPALELMPSAAVWWVVAGGVCYTVGVLFMLLDGKVRFFHAVWHLWVIAGSTCHFLAILWYVAWLP